MQTPLIRKLALLFGVLLVSAQAQAAHPGLFFDASQLSSLRSRAAGTHQGIYQPILTGTTAFLGTTVASSGLVTWTATGRTLNLGDVRDIGNSLAVFAFVAQLSTDSRYFDLAKSWLMTVSSWGNLDLDGTHDLVQAHLLAGVAVAYDLLASRLSAAEQAQVRSAISLNAAALMNASKGGAWWAAEYLQNHNWVNHASLGLAALATQGELPAATTQPWLDTAVLNARRVGAMMNLSGDGLWHEGFGYAWYGLSWHLPFVSALKRVTGTDLGDLAMVKNHPAAFAHLQLPERPNQFVLANGDFFSNSPDMGLLPLRYAASRYRDSVAQAAADAWVAGTSATTYAPELNQRVFEFLFYDPSVPSVDLHGQPLDWYGGDMQAAVFRSGWDPGALIFALKNGPIGGQAAWQWQTSGAPYAGGFNFAHDHADDNGFYLYGGNSWLAPEAEGYYIGHADSRGPAANTTVFHNSLTIDGKGQLGEGIRTSGDEVARYAWYAGRTGGLPLFGSSDHFGYTVGDGAGLYPSSLGLSRWDRHALFLDRKWVVLRDVIKSSAAHTYGWSCHFMNGAVQEGSWLHGTGENGQALGVAVVAPAAFTASISQQRPIHIENFNPQGSVYEAEVKPAAASANATFLTALIPTSEAGWATRPTVTAIDPSLPDAGLRIREANGAVSLAVFNDAQTQTRQVGSFTLNGLSAVVKYEGGNPSRVMLVRGLSLADSAHTLVAVAAATHLLEVDGLSSTVVTVSGDALAAAQLYAPLATRVVWNKKDVPFVRSGDFVVLAGGVGVGGSASSGDSGGSSGASSGGDTSSGTPATGGSGGTSDGAPSSSPGAGGSVSLGGSTELRAHSCSSTGNARQLTAFGFGAVLAELIWRRRRAVR